MCIMAHMAQLDSNTRFKILIDTSEKAVSLVQKLPLRLYMRSGKEVLRMARLYEESNSDEQAFMLYHRVACLFLNKIRELPDYNDASKEDKDFVKATLKEVLPKLEQYKASIKARYQHEYEEYLKQQAIAEQKEREERERERERIKSIEAAKIASQVNFSNNDARKQYDDLDLIRFKEAQERFRKQDSISASPSAPTLEPESSSSYDLAAVNSNIKSLNLSETSKESTVPLVDRSCKPSLYFSQSTDSSGNSVVLPDMVIAQFLSVAESNTRINKETCGILMGRQMKNNFIITHLVIPKQKGTSDSCETLYEEELIPLAESQSLFILGWIHTHPTQTAFMSSIDLHTQFNYQSTLIESIGVVCAPKFNSVGIFSLTDFGLSFIADCRQQGHHLHPNDKLLYQESKHVISDDSKLVELVDLRR